jgi:hypothetical protein
MGEGANHRYRELDAILGGTLPTGTVMSLNLGPGATSGMVLFLLSGIVGRGAPSSRAVFFKPFKGISLEQARGALGGVVPIQQVSSSGGNPGSDGWDALRRQVRKRKDAGKVEKVFTDEGACSNS